MLANAHTKGQPEVDNFMRFFVEQSVVASSKRKVREVLHSLNFTAIDFETANSNQNSACQLGVAVVKGGEIIEQKSWLIRPPSEWFQFSYIHGITWHKVANESDFGELWPQIRPYFENQVIAAHNVRFDLGVLFALAKYYRFEQRSLLAMDSVLIARRVWPCLPNHRLQTVAAHLDIPLDHHDAASDAHACAEIIRRAQLEQKGSIERAVRGYGGIG